MLVQNKGGTKGPKCLSSDTNQEAKSCAFTEAICT
jgi:hypothetical protein